MLNRLTPEAVKCHEWNIIPWAIYFQTLPVLQLMIAKGISSISYIENAVDFNWFEGLQLLFKDAVAASKTGKVHCDCSMILECLEMGRYEILEFGITNNWQLPPEWYELHNEESVLVHPNHTTLADQINRAFHKRIQDDKDNGIDGTKM